MGSARPALSGGREGWRWRLTIGGGLTALLAILILTVGGRFWNLDGRQTRLCRSLLEGLEPGALAHRYRPRLGGHSWSSTGGAPTSSPLLGRWCGALSLAPWPGCSSAWASPSTWLTSPISVPPMASLGTVVAILTWLYLQRGYPGPGRAAQRAADAQTPILRYRSRPRASAEPGCVSSPGAASPTMQKLLEGDPAVHLDSVESQLGDRG